MSDPFGSLRALGTAEDLELTPDPAFATGLRARLERALLQPAPTTDGEPLMLSPYLAVADARAAIAFYTAAFGAVLRGAPYIMDNDRIGHAELTLGESVLMLADEFPETGFIGPLNRGGSSVTLHLTVPDVDAVLARAVAAGGTLEREPTDASYGRTGVVIDPVGHRWMVQTRRDPTPEKPPRHGDVGYQSLYVPDVERSKAFFAAVLGWTYRGGGSDGGWQAEGVRPMTGLMGGAERPEVQLCFAVDDVAAAVRRVREAGGTAQEPASQSYGLLAECTDDQGMRFQVWQSH